MKNVFISIIRWFKNEKVIKFFKHFILVFCLSILIFGAGQIYSYKYAEKMASDWLHEDLDYFKEKKEIKFSDNPIFNNQYERERLNAQYFIVHNRAYRYLKIMIYYYTRYYMAISMATVSGLIAAIALLFISKSGWNTANSYVVTIFIVFFCSTIFYGGFPALFKHKKNIEQNKNCYIAHADLENRILSFTATGNNPVNESVSKDTSLSDFIHDVDKELHAIHSLPLELDPEAIPDPGKVFKGIGQ